MSYTWEFLNSNGMASQERAYLEPPCPKLLYVECANCCGELLDEDAHWVDDTPFCDEFCEEAFSDDYEE